jgi:hypothetical protein
MRNEASTPRVHRILALFESPLVLDLHVYTGKRAVLGGDTVTPAHRPGACT